MKNRIYRGAGVMLFRYNKHHERFEVLLGKRAVRNGYGQWAILGGKMDSRDKDYFDCALREFREETGVDLHGVEFQNLAVRKTDIPGFHWRTFLIITWGSFPEFQKNWENSELRWFPVSTVSKQDLWISLKHELRAFRRLVRKHELVIAYYTEMPFEDRNLLEAYRHLTHMKLHNSKDVEGYLLGHMDIDTREARRLSRALEKYYIED